MVKQILVFSILLFSLSSCFSPGHSEGVVIDYNTSLPIDSAKITVAEYNIVFTDSLGRYESFIGFWTKLEILVEKKGFQPTFISFSDGTYKPDNTVIKLHSTNKVYKPALSQNQLRFINTLIKIVFSLLNVFTLIFILINSEIRWQYIWITGILFINLIFNLLYFDFNLISYEIIHAPFFLTNYWNNPYSLKIAIPIVSIVFWILYFSKRNLIIEDILEIRNESKIIN
jgi:hypothetical protein